MTLSMAEAMMLATHRRAVQTEAAGEQEGPDLASLTSQRIPYYRRLMAVQ